LFVKGGNSGLCLLKAVPIAELIVPADERDVKVDHDAGRENSEEKRFLQMVFSA